MTSTVPDTLDLFRNLTAPQASGQDLMGENLLQLLEETDMDDLDLTSLPLDECES